MPYLTRIATQRDEQRDRSFTNQYFDDGLDEELDEDEFMKQLFVDSNVDGFNLPTDKSTLIDLNSQNEFLLNDPEMKTKEYGNIKIGTFKEWARLSILENDTDINYKNSNIPKISKCIAKLKHSLKGTEPEIVEK